MIALDTFVNSGFTETELLALRDKVKTDITQGAGKVLTSYTSPGLSSTFQVTATPLEVLRAVSYALQRINPTTYGTPLVKRTTARFV